MARIGSIMHVGRQALSNAKTALQTTSHNVANANTEGFSRQRVEQVTNSPVSTASFQIGTGAKTAMVSRVVNDFLNNQIQNETGRLGTAEGKENALQRVEQVFNESINQGLNRFITNLFNAFREFGNNPESQATRALVKESSHVVVEDFHRVNDQLAKIQEDVNQTVMSQMSVVNSHVEEIADLNHKIRGIEMQGHKANDARDRRDLLLRKLGSLINIKYAEVDSGMVNVTAGSTAVLVSGTEYNKLEVQRTPAKQGRREGDISIMFRASKTGSQFDVTREMTGGKIGGAMFVRDKIINDLHRRVDDLAYTVALGINTVHKVGYDTYNNTGQAFFKPLAREKAAEKIQVADYILKDPGRIAGALQKDSPGDNRVANALSSLQYQNLFKRGTATFDEIYNGMVGEFAVVAKKNTMVMDHQAHIVKQLHNVRESVSGVSLDEETADMIQFQKAYDASARLIRTADEMFDTLLSLKRL